MRKTAFRLACHQSARAQRHMLGWRRNLRTFASCRRHDHLSYAVSECSPAVRRKHTMSRSYCTELLPSFDVSPLCHRCHTCGMVGQLLNCLTPSLSSGSARTFRLPYSTPGQTYQRLRGHSCHVEGRQTFSCSLGRRGDCRIHAEAHVDRAIAHPPLKQASAEIQFTGTHASGQAVNGHRYWGTDGDERSGRDRGGSPYASRILHAIWLNPH